jgi:hypothetical protein
MHQLDTSYQPTERNRFLGIFGRSTIHPQTFSCFEEEKNFYTKKHCFLVGKGIWQIVDDRQIDSDIYPFIQTINLLPYAFCKGQSCSGSYNDHQLQKDGKNEYALWTNGLNTKFGIRIQEPQGFAIIRIHDANPQSKKLQEILSHAPLCAMQSLKHSERQDYQDLDRTPLTDTYSFQLFLPPTARVKHPEDTQYLTKIWKKLTSELTDKLMQK